MTKILVVNESCSDNIGDHAINYGLQKLILANGYSYVCCGFDADKKVEKPHALIETSLTKKCILKFKKRFISNNQYLKYLRWVFKNIKRIKEETNKEYSAMIIGGGQLIQTGGTFPIAMYLWTYYAHKNHIPIYILGAGCAEKFTTLDKYLYKKSFNRVNKLFIRDQHSIKNLSSFFNVKADYIPDLAYALYNNDFLKEKNPKNLTVIGATSYYVYLKNAKELNFTQVMDVGSYINMWIKKAEDELNAGNDIVLASTTVQDAVLNSHINMELIKKGFEHRVKHIEKIPTTYEYIDILQQANKVLSGRMHSLILGHISGCTLETTDINKKIDQFMLEYSTKKSIDINSELNSTFQSFCNNIG